MCVDGCMCAVKYEDGVCVVRTEQCVVWCGVCGLNSECLAQQCMGVYGLNRLCGVSACVHV